MALYFTKIKKGLGLTPETPLTSDTAGEFQLDSSTSKVNLHNGSSRSPLVTESHSATLINKTIDADLNTLSNIENADIKVGANIDRAKTASGTAYKILANNSSGVMSENAALTSSQVIIANANGQLVSEATLNPTRGGTGIANSNTLTYGPNNISLTTTGATAITVPTTGTLATLAGTETLSNKTFSNAVTYAEIATPATPAAGFAKVYPKTTGIFYLNSAGVETQLATGNSALQRTTTAINYTILSTDDVIFGDSSVAFITLTLPSSTLNLGKLFRIKKITNDTNIVTVATNGFDTITDVTGLLLNTSLNTQGEEIEIVSYAVGEWQITNRRIPSIWTLYTMPITGSSVNPTFNAGATQSAYWRRVGDSIQVSLTFSQSLAGSANGTGQYLFGVPSGITLDSTRISIFGSSNQHGVCGSSAVGTLALNLTGIVRVYNTTNFAIVAQDSIGNGPTQVSSTYLNATNSSLIYSFMATAPVSGWKG